MSKIKRIFGDIFWHFHQGTNMKNTFENLYACRKSTKTFEEINKKVFGDVYAGDIVDPCGFSTMEDLQTLERYFLKFNPKENGPKKIIDLACGRGGAGLWLAQRSGSSLLGFDLSEIAIEDARKRIPDFGMEGRAKFEPQDIRAIPAKTGEYDFAMCIDSLFIIPDKDAVLAEIFRVLKPGGQFVCFTWEVRRVMAVHDYRPLLTKAGFQIDTYEEVPGWRERQKGMHEELLANKDRLISEMNKKAASVWLNCAKYELAHLDQMRRVSFLAVAKK